MLNQSQKWTAKQWNDAEQKHRMKHRNIVVYLAIKRVIDVTLASIGLIILSPLLIGVAIAVRCSSPGPIFFVQQRLGKLGRPFNIYKFRTMVNGAVHIGTGLDTFKGDPRITPVGRFLREYHIDEFPQLFNVLRGDMSLVGPRPLLMESLTTYQEWQKRRLLMLPGMTAWEAVQGGLDNDLDERLRLDVWYVDHWSLGLDLTILICTIPVVLRKEGVYAKASTHGQEKYTDSL
jgi:sugar transferase EpsL